MIFEKHRVSDQTSSASAKCSNRQFKHEVRIHLEVTTPRC